MSKAYEVIEKPESWTQGTFAEDAYGNRVWPLDGSARCFCANGALIRAYKSEDAVPAATLVEAIQKQYGPYEGNPIARWNDAPERTHAEVYNLLKSLDI